MTESTNTNEATQSTKASSKELNLIVMQDGTTVEFPGKRKLVKTSTIADGKVSVRLDLLNGQTRLFTMPDNLLLQFAAHGAEQKLGDEIAGLTNIDDCVEAIDQLIHRLYDGKWNAERESSGLAGSSILTRAIAEATGKPIDVVRGFLSVKSQAEKLALRGNPKIKAIIDRMESEKAKKKPTIDTDALLDSLGNDPLAAAIAPSPESGVEQPSTEDTESA